MADARHGWALVGMNVCLTFKSNRFSRTGLHLGPGVVALAERDGLDRQRPSAFAMSRASPVGR